MNLNRGLYKYFSLLNLVTHRVLVMPTMPYCQYPISNYITIYTIICQHVKLKLSM